MNNRFMRVVKSPILIPIYFLDKVAFVFPDKLFLKIKYYIIIRKRLDLKNPVSFNEKLQWLKLYDRKPEYTGMVDKNEAKKYVAKIIGEEYIIPTLGVYDSVQEIDFEKLPKQFVLKCTHDSGGVVICNNRKTFDITAAKIKLEKHLKRNPYYRTREWPYKNVKPRIIVEKYMSDVNDQDLLDYKILLFGGKVKSVLVCSQRNKGANLKVDFFDENWEHLPFERLYKNSGIPIAKPKKFAEMKELAVKLSDDINAPFIRLDFYEVNRKIYFGEITFSPGGGWEKFSPEQWDWKFGSWITLPSEI